MRRLAALVLLLTLAPFSAHAEESAAAVVRAFYAQLTATMKEGPQLGFQGRFKKMSPAVETAYNIPLMARVASGPAWSAAKPEDQKRLSEAFAAFSAATYAARFVQLDGERFEVLGEKPAAGGGMLVETHLLPKDGDAIKLNYLVRNDEANRPRIVDVLLDATISELATRRAEFSAVVKQNGFEALIKMLEEKTQKMGASVS